MTCETEKLQFKNNMENMNPVTNIKEKCFQCLRGPKKIMRTLVFFVCFVVVIIQISECIKKIQNPPITTYTHFDFNETLLYPAVTLCRDPPYKYDVLQKYGLYGHPRYTSEWRYFPYGNITLSDFWNEATFDLNDNFIQLGFNGSTQDLHITNTLGFVMGNCHTIKANYLSTTATKDTGYSILLNHSLADMVTTTSTVPPGYHVFIHSQEESFAESYVGYSGLVDYLYVNVGEEVEIKLTVNRYIKIHKDDDPCNGEEEYSVALCSEMKSWAEVSAQTGCGGPWIHSDARDCGNYTEMRDLIVNYLTEYNRVDNRYKTCHRRCRSYLYTAHVTNRRSSTLWDSTTGTWKYRMGNEVYQTQLYIHFNSMMVSVYEETHSYDWSLFLADLGGSVGFLLGLSVFGGIRIIEKLWDLLIKPLFIVESKFCEEENKQQKKLNNHPDLTDDIYFKTYDNRHYNIKQPLHKQ